MEWPQDAVRALPYLLIVALTFIPTWTLMNRVGLSRWWTALSIVPFGVLVVLWILAYRRWPAIADG